jgi:hypothetical protein
VSGCSMLRDNAHGYNIRRTYRYVIPGRRAGNSVPVTAGFHRTRPTVDLALGHWMVRPSPGMGHVLAIQISV